MTQHKILVIKLGALGDFVQSLGPMAAIRRHHPKDSITLLTTKPFAKIATMCGYFDEIILDERPKWFELLKWLSLSKNLNAHKFLRVYDLQNNDRTGIYFRLFNPKPEWVGIAKGASHQNTSPLRTAGKAFNGHVQTLSLAGIDDVHVDTLDWIKSDKNFDGLYAPYVLIVAGGSKKHPEKRWPAKYFGTLCKTLVERGFKPVLIGTTSEKETNQDIKIIEPACIDLTGRTDLFDLPALARGAHAAIGNDTGPMHLIAPTGCKTIVLFGAKTHPHRHAPLGENVQTVQVKNLTGLLPQKIMGLFLNQ